MIEFMKEAERRMKLVCNLFFVNSPLKVLKRQGLFFATLKPQKMDTSFKILAFV